MKFFLKNILIPGANNRNKKSRWGRQYNSPQYVEFQKIIEIACRRNGFKPIPIPKHKNKSNRNVVMSVIVYFDKAGRSDLSGNLKCLEDSLEGFAYENDKQIKEYIKLKIVDYAGFNGVKVEIQEIK